MADSPYKDVSSLLSAFFDEAKLREGRRYVAVFRGWAQLAGPRLAAHSRVVEVERGMLIVEAEHPGWLQLLQLRQAEILEAAKRAYPELGLRGIVFHLGGGAAPLSGSEPGPSEADDQGAEGAVVPAAAGEQDRGEVDAVARGDPLDRITDEALRETLLRLKRAVAADAKGPASPKEGRPRR